MAGFSSELWDYLVRPLMDSRRRVDLAVPHAGDEDVLVLASVHVDTAVPMSLFVCLFGAKVRFQRGFSPLYYANFDKPLLRLPRCTDSEFG